MSLKVNLRSFNLYCDSNSLTLSNASELFWSPCQFLQLYPSSERERNFRRCSFTSSIKREIGLFHVVVVQRHQRNVQKSMLHVKSCCFAYSTYFFFWRYRCRRRWGILKSLIADLNTPETPRFLHRSITVYCLTTWGSIKLLIYNNLVLEKRFKSIVILATIWTHVEWKND